MAADLHALVQGLGMESPIVLVGHSFGGLVGLDYAHRWPDQVAALVLVDPTHPEQFDTFGPLIPDQLAQMKEFWTNGWRTPDGTAERIDFQRTFASIREITSLGDLPLTVLTSGAWQFADEPHQKWIGFHRKYVALSSRGRQRVLPNTDHFLQRSAPDEIVKAITEVVNELRHN
jgi:pimeloyl-ACP methyl ester carboxylesterase